LSHPEKERMSAIVSRDGPKVTRRWGSDLDWIPGWRGENLVYTFAMFTYLSARS